MPRMVEIGSYMGSSLGQAKRTNPIWVDLRHLVSPQVQEVKLRLPAGCQVVSLPKNANFSFRDTEAQFSFSRNGNEITCTRRMVIPKMEVSPQEYPMFRDFVLKIMAKEKEQALVRM